MIVCVQFALYKHSSLVTAHGVLVLPSWCHMSSWWKGGDTQTLAAVLLILQVLCNPEPANHDFKITTLSLFSFSF